MTPKVIRGQIQSCLNKNHFHIAHRWGSHRLIFLDNLSSSQLSFWKSVILWSFFGHYKVIYGQFDTRIQSSHYWRIWTSKSLILYKCYLLKDCSRRIKRVSSTIKSQLFQKRVPHDFLKRQISIRRKNRSSFDTPNFLENKFEGTQNFRWPLYDPSMTSKWPRCDHFKSQKWAYMGTLFIARLVFLPTMLFLVAHMLDCNNKLWIFQISLNFS